jgi:DNA-binding beta-propeller fold protein YncE
VVTVTLLCCAPCSGADLLTPVNGSPFPTGGDPDGVAFSPNGSLLATANWADGTDSVFAVGDDGVLSPLSDSPLAAGAHPRTVAFSPNGQMLVSADFYYPDLDVFDVGPGPAVSPYYDVVGTGSEPSSLAFTKDGSLLAVPNINADEISVYTGALQEIAASPFRDHAEDCSQPPSDIPNCYPDSAAFSPDGTLLAVTNWIGNTLSLYSVADDGDLSPVPGSPFPAPGSPSSVAFSPDGKLLAVAGDGLQVFDVGAGGSLTLAQSINIPSPLAVAFSPGGGLVAVTTGSEVDLFEVDAAGMLESAPDSPFTVGSIPESAAFSADGTLFAAANAGDNTVSVFAVSKLQPSVTTTVLDGLTGTPWATAELPGARAMSGASLSGAGPIPTGTVTYKFYASRDCTGTSTTAEEVTVQADGSVPASSLTGRLTVGGYSYQAVYSGDSNYAMTAGNCDSFTIAPPDNHFTIADVSGHADGTMTFQLTLPAAGIVDVLETAWLDNFAPSSRHRNAAHVAGLLYPAPRRFVFARAHLTPNAGGMFDVYVTPYPGGVLLIKHHRYRVVIRLWISFTPTGGTQHNIGIYCLHFGPADTRRNARAIASGCRRTEHFKFVRSRDNGPPAD